jgi:hypothetical protein
MGSPTSSGVKLIGCEPVCCCYLTCALVCCLVLLHIFSSVKVQIEQRVGTSGPFRSRGTVDALLSASSGRWQVSLAEGEEGLSSVEAAALNKGIGEDCGTYTIRAYTVGAAATGGVPAYTFASSTGVSTQCCMGDGRPPRCSKRVQPHHEREPIRPTLRTG